MATDWQEICRAERIDPEEVRLVFSRYDAYRRFAGGSADDAAALDQWFGFYRMEKASEGEQTGPAPSGCSVDSDAVNNACIKKPAQFLQALQAYRAWRLTAPVGRARQNITDR